MGVQDGQDVSAGVTNPAFINKNIDDTTPSRLGLGSTQVDQGPSITWAQRQFNSVASFVGVAINGVYNLLPYWLANNRGAPTDNVFQRVNAIDAAFDPATGHKHTGMTGEAPNIEAASIINVPLTGYAVQGNDTSVVGGNSSADVSSIMTGKVPSTGSNIVGVVVNDPYNKIIIRDSSNDTAYEDAQGNQVFGRLVEAAGVWTINFFVEIAGVETAYTFTTTSGIRWYYQVLASSLDGSSPVYSSLFYTPSANLTSDIVDASATERGVVSTGVQTLAGTKTFLVAPVLGALSGILKAASGVLSALAQGNLSAGGTDGISVSGGTGAVIGSGANISQQAADAGHNGYLTQADWSTFNAKQPAGAYITELTSDVTATGPGSVAATIANNAVTNAKAAQMPAHTIKGNRTGSTANAADLTAAQVTAELDVFVGDTGGTPLKGLVPAPTIGDAVLGKFLKADGTWAIVSGGGGGGGSSLQWIESINSATPIQENSSLVYSFAATLAQVLQTSIRVPSTYVAGRQIKLYIPFYSAGYVSGTDLMQTVSTLIRSGLDPMTFTANQRTSTNAALTPVGSDIPSTVIFDITDATGKINGVTVSPNDLILVNLVRGTDTDTADIRDLVFDAELTLI